MVALQYVKTITKILISTHSTDSSMLVLKLGHNAFVGNTFHQAYYFLLMPVIGCHVKELNLEMTVHVEDIGN